MLCNPQGEQKIVKVTNLYKFEGLKRTPVEEAWLGDIIAVSGVEGISIGATICDINHPEPLPFVNISRADHFYDLLSEHQSLCRSGRQVCYFQKLKRQIVQGSIYGCEFVRLKRPSLLMLKVSGGELHLSILIESMRRKDTNFRYPNQLLYTAK